MIMKMKTLATLLTLNFISLAAHATPTATMVKHPTTTDGASLLSYNSDENGACKYLGYDSAVAGSKTKNVYTDSRPVYAGSFRSIFSHAGASYGKRVTEKNNVVRIDAQGFPATIEYAKVMNTITCISNGQTR
jgi:hypothetical protein